MAAWEMSMDAFEAEAPRSDEHRSADAVEPNLHVRTPPLVQLLGDAALVARALARSYRTRIKPTRRGPLHRV